MRIETAILVILTTGILSFVFATYADVRHLMEDYYPLLFLFYLLAGLASRMSVAISVGAGGVLLFSALGFTLAGNEETSGQLSTYAFLFFSVGLIWALVKYIAKNREIWRWWPLKKRNER